MTTNIDITNITENTLEGNGSFDIFMRAMDTHLEREFDAGRIIGADYPNVYLGALQTAISQSIQFELSRVSTNASVDQTLAQTKLIDEQLIQEGLRTSILTDDRDISTATKDERISLSEEQLKLLINQVAVSTQQVAQEINRTSVSVDDKDISSDTKQNRIDLVDSQTDLSELQEELVKEQTKTQLNQTDNVLATTEIIRDRGTL